MDNNSIVSLTQKQTILILNRRCIKNSQKGGAENYTYQMARYLVQKGFKVKWFSSKPKNLQAKEEINGIHFIRKGNELTTHFWGFLYALKKNKSIVIDEYNGVGFFTFLLKKHKVFVLIHQLYSEFWNLELGHCGYFLRPLEKILLQFYKKKPTVTVSQSTKRDLEKLGFNHLTVIPNGLEREPLNYVPLKSKKLSLIYLGRLKKTKNPEDAIKVFNRVQKTFPETKIWIVGKGPLLEKLEKKYASRNIKFLGYVSEEKKFSLLKEAHFLLVPSIREGWGQVVIQANSMGTPAIGYKVPGLVDSIQHKKTGYLVNNYEEMANIIKQIWKDPNRYIQLSQCALNWAKNFSWSKSQRDFLNFIVKNKEN